ncbi:glycosyltransferase [Microbacterium sp.]|uniref:glycosyltransferase n=1 Tax=Microbacterium sp. TaxID=51671 RepID=UPI003241EC56
MRAWVSYPGARVLWTYTPTTYQLEELADSTVYHCVDLLGTLPGIDSQIVASGEKNLAKSGALAIASSQVVRESLIENGFAAPLLWENVADTDVFEAALSEGHERVSGRIIFAGNLSPTKVDYGILVALAQSGLEVRVAGPRAEGGAGDSNEFARLLEAGVNYLGMLQPEELARELATCSVGVIPYVINDYTRGVSPLKTYEYLASGISVVATALPGVAADDEDVFVAADIHECLALVAEQSALIGADAVQRRVKKSRAHSWNSRGIEARALIERLVAELPR